MNTSGLNRELERHDYMYQFQQFNCMPDKLITADIRYSMDELREVLQPFFMALEMSGRSIPRVAGVSPHREIVYYTEVCDGFHDIRIKPQSHWLLWTRYSMRAFMHRPKQNVTLEEIPQQFAEVYNQLGDKTILHA